MKNLLMVADSDHDANMLYAVGMFVPDPFIYLDLGKRPTLVMSDLEIDRARKQAAHCRIVSLNQYYQKLHREGKKPGFAAVIRAILREHKVNKVFVPGSFPFGLATELRDLGVKVKARPGQFFPKRELKSADEVKKISAALMMAEVGMAEAMQALKISKIGKKRQIIYRNAPLTSEKLRSIIDTAIMQQSGLASHTIVAGGKQACDPHESGYGPLRANEPIILDVFPRSQKTGYFGDITRTVVKGRASEAVKKMYDTVHRGQKAAFQLMRDGMQTSKIHQVVQELFVREGYKTGKIKGRMQGFFHGTGHGLGLEIHEAPRVGATSLGALKAGQVVTVEPGLYYPEIGGIRLEDVALVTHKAPRNLTQFEKVLEI